MIQDKKVIIAIPIYRDLREEEIVALDNNLEILRNYPTVLIKPTGLNTNALKERYPQVGEIEVQEFMKKISYLQPLIQRQRV